MAAPKLRFKEFDGDWFQSKIGEIFQVTSGSTPLRSDNRFFENADIAWVKTTDLNNGLIEKTEEKISQIALKETSVKILPKGTVFVAMYGGFNQIGRTGLLVHEAACNQALSAIYPNEKIDSYFLLTFLNHKVDDWKNFAASSRKDPNITKSDVLAFPLKYPVKEEQTKIAFFLSAVDEKISQLTQKHELLSQYKQGMMQKLFSQQIRFKADDGSEFGEWENKTLGEVGENIIGLTYSPTDVTNDSTGILVLRSSNIKEGRLDKSDQVRVNKKIKDKIIIQPNDILICTRNGSQRLIGKSVIINDDEIMTFGAFMSVYRSDYNRFIAYLMQMPWFFEQVQMNLGARINQITTGTLNEFTFDFPCLEEQTKIANFLSAIDQKNEVVAQQIEQAKIWKKGLLQQMFV